MNKPEDRVTELEIQLSHQARMLEDLSDEVATQRAEIAGLKRKVALLLENAAEAQDGSGAVIANQKPPHW